MSLRHAAGRQTSKSTGRLLRDSEYGVHKPSDPANLGGNVQAVLTDAGIDITQFTHRHNQQTETSCTRRSLKRSQSGVALPAPRSLMDLEREKERLYENGTLCRAMNVVQ